MIVVGLLLLLLLLIPLDDVRLAGRDKDSGRDEPPRFAPPPPVELPRRAVLPRDVLLPRDALLRDERPPLNDAELRDEEYPRLEKLRELLNERPPARPPLRAAIAGSAGPSTSATASAAFAECRSNSCQPPNENVTESSSRVEFGLRSGAAPACTLARTGEADSKLEVWS